MATHANGFKCAGWRTEKFRGGVVLKLCPECGLPASRVEAAEAALATTEALFSAHFADDASGALEVLEGALKIAVESTDRARYPSAFDDFRGALKCVSGVLKSIREAAEE